MRIEDNWDDVLIYSIVFTSKKDLNKEVKKYIDIVFFQSIGQKYK